MSIPNDFLALWLIILTCIVFARGNGITPKMERWLLDQMEKGERRYDDE